MPKYLPVVLVLLPLAMNAQRAFNSNIDLTSAFARRETTIIGSYEYNFRVGTGKRWELGIGGRFTGYTGHHKEYVTAPANLTKGRKGPLVFFTAKKIDHLDTIYLATVQINAVNIMANVGYRVSRKLTIGFNLDVIGISLGKSQSAAYRNITVEAKPAAFNFLRIDDNALGSLNSEFYAVYDIGKRWGVKLFYEYLYVEYETTEHIQQAGEVTNNRFRDKPTSYGFGITYYLNRKL